MVQVSFWVFVLNIICILYLMNSGEEYSRKMAKDTMLSFAVMKGQFFLMALCYMALCYGIISNSSYLEMLLHAIQRDITFVEYYLLIGGYVLIHLIWAVHFLDLSLRAHVYKYSKKGYYESFISKFVFKLINIFHLKQKKHIK